MLGLYLYQGAVASLALIALPNHLASLGASVSAIGAFMAVVGLPWTIQPLWGPVVDRFGTSRMGPRRSWVFLGLVGALACLALIFVTADDAVPLAWLGGLFLAHSVFASLVDTAADAMIIDHAPSRQLGHTTALTRAGLAVGLAAGASLFSWILPTAGLPPAVALLLALGAITTMLVLLVRESPADATLSLRPRMAPVPRRTREVREPADGLLRLLRVMLERRSLALLGFCVALEFAVALLGVCLAVAMVQEGGWAAPTVSRLQGLLALGAGTLGAFAVGWWSDRVGPRRSLFALLLACTAAHAAATALLVHRSVAAGEAAFALGLSTIAPALVFVALAPAVMLRCRGRDTATRFALFMAALNLGSVAGAAAAGPVSTIFQPWQVAWVATCILAACAFIAFRSSILFPGTGPEHHATRTSASES